MHVNVLVCVCVHVCWCLHVCGCWCECAFIGGIYECVCVCVFVCTYLACICVPRVSWWISMCAYMLDWFFVTYLSISCIHRNFPASSLFSSSLLCYFSNSLLSLLLEALHHYYMTDFGSSFPSFYCGPRTSLRSHSHVCLLLPLHYLILPCVTFYYPLLDSSYNMTTHQL